MSVKKSFADPEPARAVSAGSSRQQVLHPQRFQPLPSPPTAMPLASPARRPKLPPVPAVLKAREQAPVTAAPVTAATVTAATVPDPALATAPEPASEPAPKAEPLHADVPASVAVDMAPVPAADPERVAAEHRWGDRAAAADQPPGRELEIQLRKSNRHTVRSVRRNVSENPVPPRAAEASAKPGPTATDWDQLKSTLHSVIDDWVDRQKADAYPAR